MRLPSSSSLLLASLASSSSLSALAAPTGDCPEDSSSMASAPLNRDDTAFQSDSKSTSCTTTTFASDTVTDNPQTRAMLNDVLAPLAALLPGLYSDKKDPKARADSTLPLDGVTQNVGPLTGMLGAGRRAARAEESGDTDSPQDSSSSPAAADPNGSAQSPATPATPSPPAPAAPNPPVKLPVPVPQPPVNLPAGAPASPAGAPAGRRDASGVVAELLSPVAPRNPPNTPVQRQLPLPSSITEKLPL